MRSASIIVLSSKTIARVGENGAHGCIIKGPTHAAHARIRVLRTRLI